MAGAASGSILIGRRIVKSGGVEFIPGPGNFNSRIFLRCGADFNRIIAAGQFFTLCIFIIILYLRFAFGPEFPLAAKIYLQKQDKAGETSGILYGADLLGGWLAGIAGGIIFLPILGLFNTFMAVALFKLSAILLFLSAKKGIASV